MLLITKLFCGFYNFILIFLLYQSSDSEKGGKLLILIGIINFISVLTRLGSDTYWISGGSKSLRIIQNELYYHLLIILFSSLLIYLYINDEFTRFYYYFFIVFCLTTQLIISLVSRIKQLFGKHIISLSAQLLGGNALTIPIFLVFDFKPLICIVISHIIIFFIILLFVKINHTFFKIVPETFNQRLHHFPQLLIGALNQNIVSLMGGLLNLASFVPTTLTLQRLYGIVLLPASIEIQRRLPKLGELVLLKQNIIPFVTSVQKQILIPIVILSSLITLALWFAIEHAGILTDINFFTVLLFGVFASINSYFVLNHSILSLLNQGIKMTLVITLSLMISLISIAFGLNENTLTIILGVFLLSCSILGLIAVRFSINKY